MLLIVASTAWPVWTQAETTANSGAIRITALPIRISTPGTYYLAQDFAFDSSSTGRDAPIAVLVDGVTIDLNGHTITDTFDVDHPSGSDGVTCFYISGANCTVEDCEVSGKTGGGVAYGIRTAGYGSNNNFFLNNRIGGMNYGIFVGTNDVSKYRDTLTLNVTTPYTSGIDAGNNN